MAHSIAKICDVLSTPFKRGNMKKKIVSLILIATLICIAVSVTLIGCDDNKITYSVTLLMPDEVTPVAGVTVSWQKSNGTKGSATTNDDGTASVELASDSYSVVLSGLAENLTYTPTTATADFAEISMVLQKKQAEYSVTVIDKDNHPASNVTVKWMTGNTTAATAQTDEAGKAVKILDYAQYSVSISNLPTGNLFEGNLLVTGANPDVTFNLKDGETELYTISVKSAGGLKMANIGLEVYLNGELYTTGVTNGEGVSTFELKPAAYTISAADVPKGYSTALVDFAASQREAELTITSSVIMSEIPKNLKYVMGDIVHNFTFTTPYTVNGEYQTYSIAELLKTKKAVVLNNWGTQCSACLSEMPAMQEAYEQYKDKIEIIAISNYMGGDLPETIIDYQQDNGYTFPMVTDEYRFTSIFKLRGWPTTIIIDRYGAIARIEVGSVVNSEVWGRMLDAYIADDYQQTFTPGADESESINNEIAKPDITLSADHYDKVAQAINNATTFPQNASITWFGEEEVDYIWPFILGTDSDISPDKEVLYASNTGKDNSLGAIYATVNVKAGSLLMFEYYASTHSSDVLTIIWDGKIVKTISGDSDGWQTDYIYSDLIDGEHTLAIAYSKDLVYSTGKDNVYIRNIHFINLADYTGEMNILRGAAYGQTEEGDTVFPHYSNVRLASDGLYHVDVTREQNAALAGNDYSPILFANLLKATNWSGKSILQWASATKSENDNEYLIDCNFTINGETRDYRDTLIGYLRAAVASYVDFCVPVDEELRLILTEFMKAVNPETSHPDEWLEVCYYYSHYGNGEPIGNPILGVNEKNAIEVREGVHTANLTRNIAPFPIEVYAFTPARSGVYFFESLIPDKLKNQYRAQIWIYDETTSNRKTLAYCGDAYMTRDEENEHNFAAYIYMTAGHKYYFSVAFLTDLTGEMDFRFSYVGDSASQQTTACYGFFWQVLDENDNWTGETVLAGAVKYTVDDEGYYRALNSDGTMGDYIYLDVKYPTTILPSISLEDFVDKNVTLRVQDENGNDQVENLGFKQFDFRKRVVFTTEKVGDEYSSTYDVIDTTVWGEEYKDYTNRMKDIIQQGLNNTGDEEGLVKVNQEIVDILLLFIEMRVNSYENGKYEQAKENEWLRFCWYNKVYNAQNPY